MCNCIILNIKAKRRRRAFHVNIDPLAGLSISAAIYVRLYWLFSITAGLSTETWELLISHIVNDSGHLLPYINDKYPQDAYNRLYHVMIHAWRVIVLCICVTFSSVLTNDSGWRWVSNLICTAISDVSSSETEFEQNETEHNHCNIPVEGSGNTE